MAKKREYYGSQTKLAIEHFQIGNEVWPKEMIVAQSMIKVAAARANYALGELPQKKARAIERAGNEIVKGNFDDSFPLSLWQSGSGTQFNMNVNEVIATRANEILTGSPHHTTPVHPNDDVNMSQSTNDSVPTAIHVAAILLTENALLPALNNLATSLNKKSNAFSKLTKTGRTHLRDAVSLTLGEEFSGYRDQVRFARSEIKRTMETLREVALGGTAVGTGLNTPKGYRKLALSELSRLSGTKVKPAKNLFESMAAHDRLVAFSGSLRVTALALMKIANDVRWLSSGPNAGLSEIFIPENEPGSSIMPGKVNPTQSEALMLVACQVVGNDAAVGMAAGTLSNFELTVGKPLFAHSLIQSVRILADATESFNTHCVKGITANHEQLKKYATMSLTKVTKLSKTAGYDTATTSAKTKSHA